MADKSINTNTAVETSTMTPDKSSSGFLKFCAFIDVIAKLLIAGALIGILVVMVMFSSSMDKLLEGNASLSVKVWSGDGALRITPAYSQAFQVNMQNSYNSPLYFKAVN